MLIDINNIGTDGQQFKIRKNPQWVDNIPEFSSDNSNLRINSDLNFDFSIEKVVKEVLLNGFISFDIQTVCSRCIDPVSLSLKSNVKLTLSPKEAVEETDSDIDHEVYDGETIDLSNYFREQIALSLPVSILCRKNCKGLCLSCGTNLNSNNCSCKTEWVDTRFSILKELKL